MRTTTGLTPTKIGGRRDRRHSGISSRFLRGGKRYMYTFSKNDVISSVRKHYYASGLKLGVGVSEYVFGQTCFQASVVESVKGSNSCW